MASNSKVLKWSFFHHYRDILTQLHKAHQGIEKTQLLARESVFWQNMTKDITEMIRSVKLAKKQTSKPKLAIDST